jgi:hypothetical protein
MLCNLGLDELHEGRYDEAERALLDALAQDAAGADRRLVAEIITALAAIAARSDDPARAARLRAASNTIRNSPPSEAELLIEADYLEDLPARLRGERWTTACVEGERMSIDDAIAEALSRRAPGRPSINSSEVAARRHNR